VSILSLTSETFPKVVTVVDASIASSSSTFAIQALSSSATVFLSGQDIVSYLGKLETDDVKVQEIDFTSLKSEVAAKSGRSLTCTAAYTRNFLRSPSFLASSPRKRNLPVPYILPQLKALFLPLVEVSRLRHPTVWDRTSFTRKCLTSWSRTRTIRLDKARPLHGKTRGDCRRA
jgi:hypothetical protein